MHEHTVAELIIASLTTTTQLCFLCKYGSFQMLPLLPSGDDEQKTCSHQDPVDHFIIH